MNNKDLIKQYINLGPSIERHQISRLNNNENQSYYRARMNYIKANSYDEDSDNIYGFEDYELRYMPSNIFNTFIENRLSQGRLLNDYQIKHLSDENKRTYLEHVINPKWGYLDSYEYSILPDDLREKYFLNLLERNGHIDWDRLKDMSPSTYELYIDSEIKKNYSIQIWQYRMADNKVKLKILHYLSKRDLVVGEDILDETPPEVFEVYIKDKIENNDMIFEREINRMSDELFLYYIETRVKMGWGLRDGEKERYNKLKNGQ